MKRRLLRDVPALKWDAGKDTTLCGAMEAALRAAGDDRPDLYDWLMGCSGAAFRVRFDSARWDPEAASPHARPFVARAARVGGFRPDVVEPPFDEELRELVWDRVVESVEASLPPLARGLLEAPEFGIVVGYDEGARVLFARTYVDKKDEPSRVSFDVFGAARPPVPVFLDRAPRPPDAELARDAVHDGARVAREREPEEDERLLAGEAAVEAWIAALGRDVAPAEAAGGAFADWWLRVSLHDARRAASRFLRRVRTYFPEKLGVELLHAAEAYGYVADEAAKGGLHPFDGTVVTRFLDPSLRRGWAHTLERALAQEREAVASLARAAA